MHSYRLKTRHGTKLLVDVLNFTRSVCIPIGWFLCSKSEKVVSDRWMVCIDRRGNSEWEIFPLAVDLGFLEATLIKILQSRKGSLIALHMVSSCPRTQAVIIKLINCKRRVDRSRSVWRFGRVSILFVNSRKLFATSFESHFVSSLVNRDRVKSNGSSRERSFTNW